MLGMVRMLRMDRDAQDSWDGMGWDAWDGMLRMGWDAPDGKGCLAWEEMLRMACSGWEGMLRMGRDARDGKEWDEMLRMGWDAQLAAPAQPRSPTSTSSHPRDFIPLLPEGSCAHGGHPSTRLNTSPNITWGHDVPQSCTPKPPEHSPHRAIAVASPVLTPGTQNRPSWAVTQVTSGSQG